MRLGTVRIHGGPPRFVALLNDSIVDISEAALDLHVVGGTPIDSMQTFLNLGPYGQHFIADLEATLRAQGDLRDARWSYVEDDVTFMAPNPAPRQVLCVGGNRKGSLTVPILPEIQDQWPRACYFMKATSAVAGHKGTVKAWQIMRPVHTEGEVCLIIGKHASKIAAEDAWDYIAGVSHLNDMFAGRFVLQDGTTLSIKTAVGEPREALVTRQMVRSKSPDGMCPIGPWMTPPGDIDTPFEKIEVTTKVGQNIVQHGFIDDYEFSAGATLEEITKWITLEPGDVVSLGAFTHEPNFPLRSVDLAAPENRVVTIESRELGRLETRLTLVDEAG
jgi:2-keto-4-pentenoate hydratase/2-oxohepta-3-ene-1,7-dioic acid hydratase in catechol pathway